MKKISILAILTMVTIPALAEDVKPVLDAETMEPITTDVIELVEPVYEPTAEKERNPKTKFPRGLQMGAGASATSGINGFVGYANKNFENFWWKRLGVRVDFATTSPIKSTINSAIDSVLDGGVEIGDNLMIGGGELKAHHIGALVDFYPFGNTWFAGGWRLSAGYMTGKLGLNATLNGDVGIDGVEFELNSDNYRYSGGQIMATADAKWNYSGPYLGTGFDLGLFWGIKIYMDAGVVFTSKTAHIGVDVPTTGLERETSPGTWVPVSTGDVGLSEDIDAVTRDANDELSDIKFFPMIKLGFMYRF